MFETIVYAAKGQAAQGQQQSMLPSIIMIVAMLAVLWFIMIRPQKKREKELKNMLAALKVGDEVATIGGIHGKILRIKDDLFVLESGVGNNKSTITVDRASIARFLKQAPEKKGADDAAEEVKEENEE